MKSIPDKLHLGCGLNTPRGWLNLDGSWNAWLAQHHLLRKLTELFGLAPSNQFDIPWSSDIFIHNVRKSLPFKNESFIAIYASHLLEHLHLSEAKQLLKECYRLLKRGGVLRIMVPDLEKAIEEYVNQKNEGKRSEQLAADRFVASLSFREPNLLRSNFFYRLYSQVKDFHSHKWMYDAESLVYYFKEAGFSEVSEMNLYESRIDDIKTIELNQGLCVEGVKK